MLSNIKCGRVTENALYCVVIGVFTVFLRNIHSDKRFIGTTLMEILFRCTVGIAKIKHQLFLPKHNRLRVHMKSNVSSQNAF